MSCVTSHYKLCERILKVSLVFSLVSTFMKHISFHYYSELKCTSHFQFKPPSTPTTTTTTTTSTSTSYYYFFYYFNYLPAFTILSFKGIVIKFWLTILSVEFFTITSHHTTPVTVKVWSKLESLES